MRYRVIALLSAVLSTLAVFCIAAKAEEAKSDVKGLFLLTDYPAVTLRPGTTSSINLKLQNYGLPPERLTLSVSGVPAGWTASLIGNGQPVAAALPPTNGSVSLELRLDVPKDAPVGTTALTVNARGASTDASLPVSVTLATDLPAKLTLTPQLPELRGTSSRASSSSSRSRTRAARRSWPACRRRRRRTSTPPLPSSTAARNSTRCRSIPASRRTSS